jgi:SAM-dependent methyltransferase
METATLDYDAGFYEMLDRTSRESARVVVPVVMELLSPSSILDFGCGRGAWLAEFCENGVQKTKGVDGDFVNRDQLLIDRSDFAVIDLSKPFALDDKYDLAVCLEVAEHLPASMAKTLVSQLTKSSPAVLFSAAIPGQGGTHHVNEQWHFYWHTLFANMNYDCFDVLRPQLFQDERVSGWFRQNIFVYAQRGTSIATRLKELHGSQSPTLVPISPHILLQYSSVTGLISCLRSAIWRAVKNRVVNRRF